MTDRYEKIRKALAMRPTPGPWLFCPTNSGTFVKSERVPGYLAEVRHCRTTQDVKADAHLIAACDPDTIRELLDERDGLAAENEALRAEVDALREALAAMVSWFPSADTYRRLGFDTKTPMQVLKEAKAVLFKENGNEA
jgi:hypothetical protein